MMLNAKPLASLSSALLARKGHARPAMRPQGVAIDDLGWNDMGGHAAPAAVHVAAVPPVLVERAALAEEVAAAAPAPATPEPAEAVVAAPVPARPEPVDIAAPPVSTATIARVARDSAKQTRAGKAAFTLRLDAERHLRLRLASAIANRSGQQIVGEALDVFLSQQPGLDALVAAVSPSSR